MNLERQIQSSVLSSGDYYQSVYWMIIYGLFNAIYIIERWTCIERVNQANVLHDADGVPRFCDWVFSLHAFSTVISLLKHMRCMSLPSLWFLLMLRWYGCFVHCIMHLYMHILFAFAKIVKQVVYMCTFSAFMIWYN